MATKRRSTEKKSTGGRGSAEAIEKRRAARQLNSLFSGESKRTKGLDGRTEKRRQRLLKELKDGRRGKPLKAIETVAHTHELLTLGETFSSLRRVGIKPQKIGLDEEGVEIIKRAQSAYDFAPLAWKMLGVDLKKVLGEGAIKADKPARKAAKKAPAKKKAAAKKASKRVSRKKS